MRFHADPNPDAIIIRGYSRGELTIGDAVHRGGVIVTASSIMPLAVSSAAGLTQEHAAQLLAAEPQIVLVGTPHADDWPSAAWRAQFLSRGVGVEVMNTGAACRTYTVLVSELRRVAAVLLP